MFSKREIRLFQNDNYAIIRMEDNFIEFESKLTKQCWIVLKRVAIDGKPVRLFHKHARKENWYHLHWETYNVTLAARSIADHENYIIGHPNYLEKKRRERYA